MKATIFAIILSLSLSSFSHAARRDTSFVFSTIETPHFSIHFHQGLEEVARKAAVFAEEAHVKLVKEFTWDPSGKTELVLIVDSDFANGFATALPYNTIFIQVVPPGVSSALGEYEDWLKVLITHEYAHIVTLDPSRGYWKVVRTVFGKPVPGADILSELLFLVTAPPNSFLPRWWHEGMATWAETEYGGVGRGNSSYYDMVFRMAVAGNNLPTISQINGDVPEWPGGNLPYLYGYRLLRYISDTYGKDTLGKLTIAHSGRFPYFTSLPPQELTGGKDYSNLFDDMIAALKSEESRRIKLLSTAPFTPLRTVSNRGEILTNPRFSPDGNRIAFTKRDPHDHVMAVITDKSGAMLAEFRRHNSDSSICWSQGGGTLFFTQPEINSGYNTYQDLYSYDLANDKVTRLTHGQRLGDVDLSPDGKLFATVINSRGNQNLALIEMLDSEKVAPPRLITGYAQQQRVSSPRWSPDASMLSYAVTDNAGQTAIHLYDVAPGKERTLFSATHVVAYPVWSRDGSTLIYVSDETGVFNLFAYDLKEGKSYQVSHLLGGALQPDISPDGKSIIFSSYDSHGFSIAEMALDREKWSATRGPSLLSVREAPMPVTTGVSAGDKVPAADGGQAAGEGEAQAPITPYSSLPTLLPHFWLPRISGDGSGKAVLGLFTAGADVLGYNSYSLTADYSTGRSRGYFDLNYRNDYFYPTLFLKAHTEPLIYSNLLQRGDYYELDQRVTLGATYPINFLESGYSLTGGYQLKDQQALSNLDGNGRFNGVPVFQGRQDNLFAGISFSNVIRYPYSVSSEEGRRISLLYRRFIKGLGSDQDFSEYSAVYQEFLRLPTASRKHQIIYLRLSGALSDLDTKFGQQAFQIGGIPSDLNPYPLRGFPERWVTGKYVATGTLELRSPLFYPMNGSGTDPFFAEKVHSALFVDAGEVWDDNIRFGGSNVKVGAGVEARLDVTLGYWLKVTPALGFAHGFGPGGEDRVYLTVYMNL